MVAEQITFIVELRTPFFRLVIFLLPVIMKYKLLQGKIIADRLMLQLI